MLLYSQGNSLRIPNVERKLLDLYTLSKVCHIFLIILSYLWLKNGFREWFTFVCSCTYYYHVLVKIDCQWGRRIWTGHQGKKMVEGGESYGISSCEERGVDVAHTLWTRSVSVWYLRLWGNHWPSSKWTLGLHKERISRSE